MLQIENKTNEAKIMKLRMIDYPLLFAKWIKCDLPRQMLGDSVVNPRTILTP
jgi:hypothetical protein